VVTAWKDARERREHAEAPTRLRRVRSGPRYGILDQSTASLRPPDGVPLAPGVVQHEPTIVPDPPRRATSAGSQISADDPTTGWTTPPEGKAPGPARVRVSPPPEAEPRTKGARTPPPPARGPRRPEPKGRRRPSAEEDDTLPFFDQVNVGTYALDPVDEER
jgi:hypothetical protein